MTVRDMTRAEKMQHAANLFMAATEKIAETADDLARARTAHDNAKEWAKRMSDELMECVGTNIPRRVFQVEGNRVVIVDLNQGVSLMKAGLE